MKTSLAAVSLLLVAFCSEGLAAPAAAGIPTSCCFTFATRKPLQKNIQDHFLTSSHCSKPAVIFVLKRDNTRHEVCADPAQPWVQEYISQLTAKKLNSARGLVSTIRA